MMDLQVNVELLRAFEAQLDPQRPEAGPIAATVLGYGEISTVFAISGLGAENLAYKRLPIFETWPELTAYEQVYGEYNRLLAEAGIRLPAHASASLASPQDRPIFFIVQERLDPASIGSRVIHRLSAADVRRLVRQALRELARVWTFNRRSDRAEIGIDGQISNWSIVGFDGQRPRLGSDVQLRYLDTSTPLMRIDGQEQLDPELFLRGAPSFLAWLLRRLFLADVVARYYDFHRVAVDLIANFYKEQLPDLVPALIEEANDFFAHEASALDVAPISLKEVRAYYREDALIWSLYQSFRRADRFLQTRIRHRYYPYILPEIAQR